MWLIVAGVAIFILAVYLAPRDKTVEPIAQPKESELVVSDICDEMNELEAKILRGPSGMSIPDSEWNQEIFARQSKIINDYHRAGVTIDMDIATQRWKVK